MHPREAGNIYQAHIRFPAERSLPVPLPHFGSGKQTLSEDLHGSLYDSQQDDLPLSCAYKAQAATVRNVLELLRRIISFGIKTELIDPAEAHIHFEMPQLNNTKTEDLSPLQLKNLLAVLDATSHKKAASMMKLALFSGMRRGELFSLKWEHIDWERGFINLVGQDDGLGAKSGQTERIPLNEMARSLLSSFERTTSP